METTIALHLLVTFACGLVAVVVRMPPLLGFLGAGMALTALGVPRVEALDLVAELGVTMLLFGIGLKFDVRTLIRREVWLTASVHMALSALVGAGFLGLLAALGFGLLAGEGWGTFVLVGFALSFSSTVVAVKVLEDRNHAQALYGRVAIGILLLQDVAAVAFLAATQGHAPSPWALALVGLVPASWVFRRIFDRMGHAEMQVLFGIVMAFVPGFALFELVGVRGDIGALVVGLLLSPHPAAEELARSLFSLKELLLVGFFVSVGMSGLPTVETLALSLVLLLLIPVQTALYVGMLWWLGLRRRTAILAGIALANFSEFALIIASVGADTGLLAGTWVPTLEFAVALSFVAATVLNRHTAGLALLLRRLVPARSEDKLHPDDRHIDVGDATVVVLGVGRLGRAAYDRLTGAYGLRVLGVDLDEGVVGRLRREGLNVVHGDATDDDFWDRITRTHRVRIAVLAMPERGSNLSALQKLHASEFAGVVAVVAQFADELVEMAQQGAQAVFHLYEGAGVELADRAASVAGLALPAEHPEIDGTPQ